MNLAAGAILSLAYILGLLSTAIPWGLYGFVLLAVGAAIALPRLGRTSPWPRLLLIVGIVGLLAALYFQVRSPQPASNDISKFVPSNQVKEFKTQEQLVTVEGKVASVPRLTRNQKAQFWLEATQLSEIKGSSDKPADVGKPVEGKLYVTVPLLQGTGLYPGQDVALTGILYKLKPASSLGGFDFPAYLARVGAFAGFSGRQINFPNESKAPQWEWRTLSQRIIRSQVQALGSPEGMLLSSLVLGSRIVDLPYEVKDQFVQVGLAHAIAAFGFKTCLILGLVLALTQHLSFRVRLGFGTAALVIYLALTGLHPLALRAAVLGLAAFIAAIAPRKRKPWQFVLMVTTLMLLFNPLWIWDLEFQLSFLASLGLLVTFQPITNRLNWLPPVFAAPIAVPIAISLWTLPLQLYAFSSSSYSIPVNIIAAIPLSVLSIAGMISAIAASIWPLSGSTIADLLYYPIHWLILLVQYFCHLPENSVALGTIPVLNLVALYGLLGLVWLQPWWQRRWWIAALLAVSLVYVPVWQTKATLFRVTVLSTPEAPILVIQDQGQVTLINSGNLNTTTTTVLPFLQQHGIYQIDWAVALDSHSTRKVGWPRILAKLPVKTLYISAASTKNSPPKSQDEEKKSKANLPSPQSSSSDLSAKDTSAGTQATLSAAQVRQIAHQSLPVGQTVQIGSTTMKLISAEPPLLQLQIRDQTWMLVGALKSADSSTGVTSSKEDKLAIAKGLPHASVLCWRGELMGELLQAVQPKVAIASSAISEPDTTSVLYEGELRLYWAGRDGTIQWTPGGEFETNLEATENDGLLL